MERRIFDDDHEMFRDSARRFFQNEIEPNRDKWREQGQVDRDAWLKAGEQGLLLMQADEKYGGAGIADFRYEQILTEENVRHGDSGLFLTLHSRLVAPYIIGLGTEEQKQRFLPKCASGETILGIAMTETGTAEYLAAKVMSGLGEFGPWPVIMGLYFVTAMATMIIPTAALVVLMSPIVISACAEMSIAPHTAMMAVAMAASASFTSPISHPANILVMGPGGYRFTDYIKLGIPLTLVIFVVVMILLPIFWPLQPL